MASHLVTIIDRPSWYVPAIERQVLLPLDIGVEVGRKGDAAPGNALSAERLSRISAVAVPRSELTADAIVSMAEGSSGIMVVGAMITDEVIRRLPGLRVIGRYGIGLDNIDLESAERYGVAVVSAPGFCADEVADHTMMLILAISRRVMFLHTGLASGRWLRGEASPMPALRDQVLGLVGFGQIGKLVARRAKAFGLKVAAYDPHQPDAAFAEEGVERMELTELAGTADWLSLHVPYDRSTRHVVGAELLAVMKGSAVVINTGRGALVDEAALLAALDAGRLAGAALDVFETEPVPRDHPLLGRLDVVLTPHIAGLSDESQQRCRQIVAQGVGNVLRG